METIKRNVGGVEVEIRILDDGIDLYLPGINPQIPVAVLDLFYMTDNGKNMPKTGFPQVLIYDTSENFHDDAVAMAICDPDGIMVVPADGGSLYDGAIQNMDNVRENPWKG